MPRRSELRTRALGAALLAVALAGCGEIYLEAPWTSELRFSTRALDFGEVEVGKRRTLTLRIYNQGRRSVTLEPIAPPPPFSWNLRPGPLTVPGRDSTVEAPALEIPISFSPGADQTARYSRQVGFRGPDGDVVIRLDGQGIEDPVRCAPSALDFGRVVIGEERPREGDVSLPRLACTNRSSNPARILVLAPRKEYGDRFVVDLEDQVQEIPAYGRLEIPVRFLADGQEGAVRAFLPILDGDDTREWLVPNGVELTGTVVPTQVVQFGDNSPAPGLDFGFVPLDRVPKPELSLPLRNRYELPVTLETTLHGDPAEFQLVEPPTSLGAAFSADDTGSLRVRFEPKGLGHRYASVQVSVGRGDSPRRESTTVFLHGFGGGPEITCDPHLDFGKVAVQASVTGRVRCRNEGPDLPIPDDDFEIVGVRVGGIDFTPTLVRESASEFRVDVVFGPRAYDGLYIDELEVVTCVGPGCSQGRTPDDPLRECDRLARVDLAGTAVWVLPEDYCDAAFEPPALDFGSVAPGEVARLGARLVNRGASPCLLSPGIDLAPGASPALVFASTPPLVLEAGESRFIPMEFRPGDLPGGTEARATVEVGISNPMRPRLELPVRGIVGRSCLELDPPRVDFTASPEGRRAVDPALPCGAPDVRVRLRNRCADPGDRRWVTSIHPATGTDPAFQVLDPGALTGAVLPPASHEFVVDFRPTAPTGDEGAHGGILVETAGPGGQRESLFLPVQGRAAAGGTWFDGFDLVTPRLDLLFVVSASYTMGSTPVLSYLSAAAPDLEAALTRPDIDWQLGITTTDLASPGSRFCTSGTNLGEAGRLVPASPGPGAVRVLSPAVPDVVARFRDNVAGIRACHTEEKGFDAARLAVTEPLVSAANAGFSRDGSHLAVVFVSSSDDPATGGSGLTPAQAFEALAARRPPGLFSAWAVVGPSYPTSGCSFPTGGSATVGTRYMQLAGLSGNLPRSVCSPGSWPALWDAVAQKASRSQSSYTLDAPTRASETVVKYVRGGYESVLTPNRDWTADPTPGVSAIVIKTETLKGLLERGAGGRLEVRYPLTCD